MQKLLDGAKNSILQFSGEGTDGKVPLFRLADLGGSPKVVKLQAILYSFEDKGGLIIDGEIIPLSGRGKLDFEQFHPLPIKETLEVFASGSWFMMLDLEKH